jgi:hypothetical protein
LGALPASPSVPTERGQAAVLGIVELAFIKGATAGVLAALDDDASDMLTARIAAKAKAYALSVCAQ